MVKYPFTKVSQMEVKIALDNTSSGHISRVIESVMVVVARIHLCFLMSKALETG